MGRREEGAQGVVIRGYSGKIRPSQLEAGTCRECRSPVFVDSHEVVKTTVDRVEYLHLGCERLSPFRESSTIIPIPEYGDK